MNLAGKAITSPGRPEKYPAPVMRFLRSNAASKSRGKSRSNSPMFLKKNNIDQEPTSPKVTCIGQVRSKARTRRVTRKSTRPCSCWKIKSPIPLFFCPNLGKIPRPRLIKPDWRKWALFFRTGCCRKSEISADSVKIEDDYDDGIEGFETEMNVEVTEDSEPMCPPKNALLLTRCRSAPNRSSSLASRFWAISETGEKTEDDFENRGRPYHQLENGKTEEPISETENARVIKENLKVIRGSLIRKSEEIEENSGDLKVIGSSVSRKSEEIEENSKASKVEGDLISRKSEEIEENPKESKVNGEEIEENSEDSIINGGLISRKREEIEENSKDLEVKCGLISRRSDEIEENSEDLKLNVGLSSRKSEEISRNRAQPTALMRCKSEPARTGKRLNPNLVVN